MPVPYWPAALRQAPRRGSWAGGPQDTRAKFEPEYGPPLMRRRTTAETEVWQAMFPNLTAVMQAAFRTFWATDLAGGALAFAWRDPATDEVGLWRILGSGERGYDMAHKGAGLADLTLQLVRLPGLPWWAPYVRAGTSKPPQVVADWDGAVYGIDGVKVAASALPAVTGTFDVWSLSTSDVDTFTAGVVIGAGDIPATAPALTKRRSYFLP